VGQATNADCRRRGQPDGHATEQLAVAGTQAHALRDADAAPPHAGPVGHGVPGPDGHAASDRDAATDRRADVRVPDGHPGTHPVGGHTGSRLISAAGRPPRTAWAA
jgi:hypothetical protein